MNDNGNGKASGGFPPGAAPKVPSELVELMKMVGQGVANYLALTHNEIARTNPKRIQRAAAAAAADLPQLRVFQDDLLDATCEKLWGIKLVKPSLIEGGTNETLVAFSAPMRLEQCKTGDEVLSSMTIQAIVTNDGMRGLLYLHGYRLVFMGTGEPDTVPILGG